MVFKNKKKKKGRWIERTKIIIKANKLNEKIIKAYKSINKFIIILLP